MCAHVLITQITKSLNLSILYTAQGMIIDGTLIAKNIDIKVAIPVEISVTGVYYQFGSLIGILIVGTVKSTSFFNLRIDYNQQPIAILVAL